MMMWKLSLLLVAVGLLSAAHCLGATPKIEPSSVEKMRFAEAIYRETIPLLEIDAESAGEALAKVRQAWERTHPDEPFFVALTDFERNDYAPTADPWRARVTMTLKNVRFIDALREIGNATGRYLKTWDNSIRLEGVEVLIGPEVVIDYRTSPQLLKALGLKPDATPEKVVAVLKRFGFDFPQGTGAALVQGGTSLVMKLPWEQRDLHRGVFHLLEQGFTITK